MSITITNHKFIAAAAFGAAALFSVLSFGSTAEAAKNLSQCAGKSTGAVISCCERLTEAQRPTWMIQSQMSCRQLVTCGSLKSSERRCYVRRIVVLERGGENEGGGERGEQGRDSQSLR